MRAGSKVGCVVDAVAKSAGEMRNGFRVAGHWRFEGFAPLKVSDPAKMHSLIRELAGERFLGADQESLLLSGGLLHFATLDRLRSGALGSVFSERPAFSGPTRLFGDIERLVSGGNRLFDDHSHNRIVDVALTNILDVYFSPAAGPYTAGWYVGLTAGSPTSAAGDIMSSHTGWTEVTAYSESTRQAYTPAAAASKSITNSSAKATFSINANGTVIGGAFLTTVSTKSGTTGTLCSVCTASQGDQTLGNGSTLQATCMYTQADDATGG